MDDVQAETDLAIFIAALRFASLQHRDQRRKGRTRAPYINHPIELVEILWDTGGVRDMTVLIAALLHDTIEDTGIQPEALRVRFGDAVTDLVLELTDDKSLPQAERKRLQVENAPHKSPGAKLIKLADKISNVQEITNDPPAFWSLKRRRAYLDWSKAVVDGLRGQNAALEERFDRVHAEGMQRLQRNG